MGTAMSLALWGWNEYFAEAFVADGMGGEPARVVSESSGKYHLACSGGEVSASLKGSVGERPVTGDWVAYDAAAGTIRGLLPRRTKVSRKKAGRAAVEQVLAANVDVLFLVTALDGDFNIRRLERYLILAHESGASPVVVLNKCDLAADPIARLRELDAVTGGLVPALLLSALDEVSVAQLHRHMEPGQTAALLGSSGVGKSTIVNRLLRRERQATREVRAGDSRGRHTTSTRELFPLDAGWLLIDTPGLRELAPWASPEAVAAAFPELQELAAQCRFRDCGHQGEPGCAVALAVEAGRLSASRLESFRKLQGELRRLERMQDARAAQEEKRRWKQIHRALRRMPDKRE